MVNIFSDSNEISYITSQLEKLKVNFAFAGNDITDDLKENEFYIFHLSNLDSFLFQRVISIPSSFYYKSFIILTDNKNLLSEIFIKIGFQHVIEYPEYEAKLEYALIDNGLIEDDSNKVISETINESLEELVGNSSAIRRVKKLIEAAALNPELNVLILGETGTGKGLTAQAIHNATFSQNAPYTDVICNSISEALLESEFFGHVKTLPEGTVERKAGLFELTDFGSIYLDGIENINLDLQTKLSAAIEKKSFRKIGDSEELPLKSRIISSSSVNLKLMLEENEFREDLYYRLGALIIEIPSLKDRPEDIIPTANYFIGEVSKKYDKGEINLDDKAAQLLNEYDWPGNIRELKNAVERAVILSRGDILFPGNFELNPTKFLPNRKKTLDIVPEKMISLAVDYKNTDLEFLTQIYAKEVLEKMKGSKIKTAKLLNISRPKLDKLLNLFSKKDN